MAQPAQLVGDHRAANDRLLDAMDELAAIRQRWDALGGVEFVAPFFEANPTYDFTADDMATALSSAQAIADLLAQGHGTNLNRVR